MNAVKNERIYLKHLQCFMCSTELCYCILCSFIAGNYKVLCVCLQLLFGRYLAARCHVSNTVYGSFWYVFIVNSQGC